MSDCDCGEFHDKRCPVGRVLRGSWRTPMWLADAIGHVYLDPCAALDGFILAKRQCVLRNGGDGLVTSDGGPGWFMTTSYMAGRAGPDDEVFVNPPYTHVLPWVKHYGHTRYTFLLRWDPSTVWFKRLIKSTTHVWTPKERLAFEPPPRIRASTSPFPHALYMRDPPADRLARLAPHGYLFRVDGAPARDYGGTHGHQHDDRARGADAGGGGVAPAVGAGGGACRDCGQPARVTHGGLCGGCLPG